MNDNLLRVCSTGSRIRFKNMMLESRLCDYSDACIFVSGSITTDGAGKNDPEK